MRNGKTRGPVGLAGAALLLLLSAACGPGGATEPGLGKTEATGIPLPPEATHVHGVGVDPGSGEILVATHAGLYVLPAPGRDGEAGPVEPAHVGPVIDLMGFAALGPGRFVASGHPGPGTDMPDPVGLIETRDGGATWRALSLAGESDFHALDAAGERVIGFDGGLRASEDGRRWDDLDSTVHPLALTMSDDGRTVVATTQSGVMRSTDGGASFTPVADAPLLLLVDQVAGTETVYGVTPEGKVHRSDDGGASWTPTGAISGEPAALHADADQLVVVADHHVSRSTDGGGSFAGW
ncbi:hypothetical protein GCM10027294_23260 [Marinactinospora endophytica]